MGAWIETRIVEKDGVFCKVASYMGAWIETDWQQKYGADALSHPTWVRGLKLFILGSTGVSTRRILHGCVD